MQRTFDARTHKGRGVVYLDGPGGSQVAKPAMKSFERGHTMSDSEVSNAVAGWVNTHATNTSHASNI